MLRSLTPRLRVAGAGVAGAGVAAARAVHSRVRACLGVLTLIFALGMYACTNAPASVSATTTCGSLDQACCQAVSPAAKCNAASGLWCVDNVCKVNPNATTTTTSDSGRNSNNSTSTNDDTNTDSSNNDSTTPAAPCSKAGDACCQQGTTESCSNGLVCAEQSLGMPHCAAACGAAGQPCCRSDVFEGGTCSEGLSCTFAICSAF